MPHVFQSPRRLTRRLVAIGLSAAIVLPASAQQAPVEDDDLLDLVMPIVLAAIKKNQVQPPVSESYRYDALGRIEQVTYSNGATVTYTYDAAGNRKAVARTAPASSN
ncbi:RHS repeat protein [Mitsuaria sp. GD03876]|uniref:RHS repeat protein n=1 Tax=Mitsuaria sp. GD03876 TaxID=2975399 RepID=UPI00244AC871|nr:RHS repeat protein [Mitsuaria sp. GD03876]MDH0863428.1 RHS repeat protein [Mitsuaria sp. GD03876]